MSIIHHEKRLEIIVYVHSFDCTMYLLCIHLVCVCTQCYPNKCVHILKITVTCHYQVVVMYVYMYISVYAVHFNYMLIYSVCTICSWTDAVSLFLSH